MYRTDKQFMKNPATTNARVYVGSLPKTIISSDLEAKFAPYGNILGLVLQQGFAFIQYETEQQAKEAIKHEHGCYVQGRKINVKQALENRHLKGGPPPLLNRPPNRNLPPLIMKNPQGGPPKPDDLIMDHPEDNFEEDMPPRRPMRMDPPNLKGGPPFNRPAGPPGEHFGGRGPPPGPREHFGERGPPPGPRPFFNRNDEFNARPGGPFPPQPPPQPIIEQPPERNDCEIIVVAKDLTEYAEYIEQQLKQVGLIVDLLFPNEDVPIGRVLANISSRGCLYAILIMPQNEENRSLTLNILHGIPQEHRNIPLDDAVLLVSRNFEAYMRGDKPPKETPGKMALSDPHPVAMKMLLSMLAENRQITTSQYDKLFKYLEERRELQNQYEIAEGIEQNSQETGGNKQAELQSRIMNILNKSDQGNTSTIPESITGQQEVSQSASSSGPTPLLKDPSVQKALDSLLLGDMFKNMSGSA